MGGTHSSKKKPYIKALFFGILSIGLYTGLLLNQDLINNTFGKGGMNAALPIATAFVFSFIHGTFTGDFWTCMGVEAARKKGGK